MKPRPLPFFLFYYNAADFYLVYIPPPTPLFCIARSFPLVMAKFIIELRLSSNSGIHLNKYIFPFLHTISSIKDWHID